MLLRENEVASFRNLAAICERSSVLGETLVARDREPDGDEEPPPVVPHEVERQRCEQTEDERPRHIDDERSEREPAALVLLLFVMVLNAGVRITSRWRAVSGGRSE